MSDAFYPADVLFHDRKFLLSVSMTLIAALAAVFGVISFLEHSKIAVTPIAVVEFVPAPANGFSLPISQLLDVKSDKASHASNSVWSGYFVDVKEICDRSEIDRNRDSIVVMKTNYVLTAGIADIDAQTCELSKKLKDGEALYATSDTPFASTPSEKRFLTLESQGNR
jgi:hypothetical protein